MEGTLTHPYYDMKQQARSNDFLTTLAILFWLGRDAFRSNVKLNPQIKKMST